MGDYAAYQAYKPSNVAWLGDIPEHWDVWKVTHGFNRIGSGTTPKSDNPIFYDGNVPWVTTSELREAIITDTAQKVTEEAVASYSALKIYPKGSLAIAMYGATIGRLGMLGVDATFNQACCVFAEPTVFDTRFVYYWLWMRRPILISLSNGGGQPNLSQDDLKKLWIPTPCIPEQQAIARFLDFKTAQIDALIAKKKALLDKLAEKRTALISHAVTKGLDPTVAMKDSKVEWLGSIPKDWKETRVKFLGDLILGLTYSPDDVVSDGGTLVLRSSNVQEGKISLDDCVYVSCDIPKKVITKADDILICSRNGSRALIGKCALLTEEVSNQAFGAFMTVLRSRHARFLYYVLNSTLFKFQSGRFLTSTINQLTTQTLGDFEIALPPEETQAEIVNHLDKATAAIDAQCRKAQTVIDRLTEYRAALITNAVTGKIDVRSVPIPVDHSASEPAHA